MAAAGIVSVVRRGDVGRAVAPELLNQRRAGLARIAAAPEPPYEGIAHVVALVRIGLDYKPMGVSSAFRQIAKAYSLSLKRRS